MTYDIVVPPTADGAQEVIVRRWLSEIGQPVKTGKDLVEATTQKIALYVPAPADGVLADIVVPVNGTARIGDVLGHVQAD
jgi:pyruvate/2-oxoglutarate dehydrogenase complex dihydrolipoamide acyltransferase (E2) component